MKNILLASFILMSYICSGQSFFTAPGGSGVQDSPVELGARFKTSKASTITGLRFYKSNAGTQLYTLKLYSGSSLVASANYSGAATGWINLSIAPVQVVPDTLYTVSYFSTAGFYQAANPYPWPVSTGALTATGSVFKYGGGYPVQTFQTSNYFADIIIDTVKVPVQKDSIFISGELYVKASTIKKDTVTLPSYCPDSSWIFMSGANPAIFDSTLPKGHIYEQYEISMPAGQRIKWSLYIERLWKREISNDSGATWIEK